jgi:hypothetical protein
MALLSTQTAAAVIGVPVTKLRLFLCREGRAIIPSSVQGRQRPIPDSALLTITLAFVLARDLGAPLAATCPLALRLVSDAAVGSDVVSGPASDLQSVALSPTVTLRVDLELLRSHLRASLAEQLEMAPDRPPRGRRPARGRRGRS